jgi:hypothetical protein
VTPVAELLIEGGVPVIFYSGLDLPAALRERYPSAPAYKKPTPSLRLLNELATLISGSRRALAGQLLQMLSASSARVYSNLLVLVRNKHPPAPAHDGKGLGEVDEVTTAKVAHGQRLIGFEVGPDTQGDVIPLLDKVDERRA